MQKFNQRKLEERRSRQLKIREFDFVIPQREALIENEIKLHEFIPVLGNLSKEISKLNPQSANTPNQNFHLNL